MRYRVKRMLRDYLRSTQFARGQRGLPLEILVYGLFFLVMTAGGLVAHLYEKANFLHHSRDYQFYLNTYHLTWSSLASKPGTIALHPEGQNVFGFFGTDGFPTILHNIHFSPITLPLSFLFSLGGEIAILVIYATVVCAGVLLVTREVLGTDRRALIWASFFLISVSPLVFSLISYDLRVWIPFAGLTLMLVFAIHTGKKAWVILLLSLALLGTREESIFPVVIASIHLLALGRKSLSASVVTLSLFYLCLCWLYFSALTDFSFEWEWTARFFMGLTALGYAVAIISFTLTTERIWLANFRTWLLSFAEKDRFSPALVLLFWALLYLVPVLGMWTLELRQLSFTDATSPRYAVAAFILALLGVHLTRLVAGPILSKIFIASTVLVGLLSSGYAWHTSLPRVSADIVDASDQISTIKNTISQDSRILISLSLHQAFWNWDARVVERLPARFSGDRGRFWPENKDQVIRSLNDFDYILLDLAAESTTDLVPHLSMACEESGTVLLCHSANR